MKNKFLIIIIVLMLIGVGGLTYYKLSKKDKKNDSSDSKLITIELNNKKKNTVSNDVLDKETYADSIVPDNKELTYTFYDDDKTIDGKIYLDADNRLHITTDTNYDDVKVSGLKFKSLYGDNGEYEGGIYCYLISEDNKLYYFGLHSNNIKDVELMELPIDFRVTNFADMSFENDIEPSLYKVFVLANDGNIYEAFSGLRYSEGIKSLFNRILVFSDNTMVNRHGNILQDKDGNPYKIKYVFTAKSNENYLNYDSIIIITEDNRMLTLLDEDNYDYVYEDPAKVTNITFDKKYPFIYGNLKIDFGADTIDFEAECSSYYCINEFDTTESNVDIGF